MEYQALLNVEQMIRVAMIQPDAGEFLVVAIQSLDQVRRDEGIEVAALVRAPADPHDVREVSGLAQALIKKAMAP
jgi:hypothetical protein